MELEPQQTGLQRNMVDFCEGPCQAKQILQVLNTNRQSATLTDVVLQVDGSEFPSHRAILSASCLYFHAMFNRELRESRMSVVPIQGITALAMETVLSFLYEGKVVLDEENIEGVFRAADLLGVIALRNMCARFLEECVDHSNCLGILDLARSFFITPLVSKCENLLYDGGFEEISKHREFLSQAKEQVVELLTSDQLHVEREEILVEAVLKWVHHNSSESKDDLKELLELVRQRALGRAEMIVKIGCQPFGQPITLDKLNPYTREWVPGASIPSECWTVIDICVLQNEIYLSGVWGKNTKEQASQVWRYTPRLDHWVQIAHLDKNRGHSMAALHGKLYVVENAASVDGWMSSVSVYNTYDNQWQTVAPLPLPVPYAAAVSCSGKLYIFGGQSTRYHLNKKVQCYDPQEDRWANMGTCPFHLKATTAVTHNSTIYLTGVRQKRIYSYTPKTNDWSIVAILPVKICLCKMMVCEGKVYIFAVSDRYEDYLWSFCPTTRKLTEEIGLCPSKLSNYHCVTITQRLPQFNTTHSE